MKKILKQIYHGIKYSGNTFQCPICEQSFGKMKALEASWYVRNQFVDHYTKNAICPNCDSWIRHRFLVKFIEKNRIFDQSPLKLLHFAPEDHLSKHILNKYPHINYFCGDIDIDRYKHLQAIQLDIADIKLDSESFEGTICLHVLELIKDDLKAISEMYRILKKGGFALIGVPIYGEHTESDPTLNPEQREKMYGYAENHRLYGLDFKKTLESVGFVVEIAKFSDIKGNYYDEKVKSPHVHSDQYLFYCIKK